MRKIKLPKISVIIPCKPGRDIGKALVALRRLDYPKSHIEVIVSYGTNPSRQRNHAAKEARGQILYFLDNDSEVDRYAFKRAVHAFDGEESTSKDVRKRGLSLFPEFLSNVIVQRFFSGIVYKGEIAAVGGPSIWKRKENFWSTISGATLESFFAHSLMAARYRSFGNFRRATEKQLILCNLAIKRKIFWEVGGLNELLYPNEENELLNRIEKKGYQLVYHPGIIVTRPRRETPVGLMSAFFNYGRGRMEQIRVEGVNRSILPMLPLLFVSYLVSLPFVCSRVGIGNYAIFLMFPGALYFLLAIGSSAGIVSRKKKIYLLLLMPLVFLLVHTTYAAGMVYGLFRDFEKVGTKGRRKKMELVRLKSFDKGWVGL